MSQPPPYNRQTSFSNLQALNPTGQPPGNLMDAEFNAIKTALDAIDANLVDIQNDDTTLANGSVGPAQLSPQLTLGFTAPSVWVTAQAYTASPASTVLQGTALYICLVSHTSGVFATDLANGKWLKIFDLSTLTFGTASQIAVSAHGSNVATNVQTSLNNLDDNKAATSHTHTASQISDSTTAGRAMLTAANVAAQQTLLGLGSLAFLSSVPAITNIPSNVAFTGSVTPAPLGADINDYTPTAWSTLSTLLQSSTVAVKITGLGATTDGDVKFVENSGSFAITLMGNSLLSAVANRIRVPFPLILRPGQGALLRYNNNGGFVGWTVLTPATANPTRGGQRNLRMGNVANVLGDSAPVAPNTQVYLNADQIVLEDVNGATWRTSVTATIDGTIVGVNGIDTGALGASTWYAIWAVGDPASGITGGLISLSGTAPGLIPAQYFKVLVGWMRTDGSSHFLKTLQMGYKARYSGTFPTITSGNSGGADFSVTNIVPSTAVSISIFPFGSIPSGTVIAASPTGTASPGSPLQSANATGSTQAANSGVTEFLLEAATVHYSSTAGAGPGIACYGWTYSE